MSFLTLSIHPFETIVKKQLNSLSVDYEQLKKNRDTVSKYLVDRIVYNGIVKL